MTGTGQFPRINEPGEEPWRADTARWSRMRPARIAAGVLLVVAGAGWIWSGDWVGGLAAATFAAFPLWLIAWLATGPNTTRRLDAVEAGVGRGERDRADLHLQIMEVSSRLRNHELDELAEKRARKGQT